VSLKKTRREAAPQGGGGGCSKFNGLLQAKPKALRRGESGLVLEDTKTNLLSPWCGRKAYGCGRIEEVYYRRWAT